MIRSCWKGTISFGLVTIPIQLYTAVKKHVMGFRLLHAKCGNPLAYKRWCNFCDEEVPWNQVLKGLKLKDGSYFVIDQDSLQRLKPGKTDNIVITEFVNSSEIYSVYLDEHYYVGSNNLEDRTYSLFYKALKKTKLVAVGRFVMRDKEHVCIIEPYNDILLLTTLNYSYEIQDDKAISGSVPLPKLETKELALASLLIDKLYSKEFDLTKYKDTFAQKLLKALTSEKGRKTLTHVVKEPKKKHEIQPSLLYLLKESVEKK